MDRNERKKESWTERVVAFLLSFPSIKILSILRWFPHSVTSHSKYSYQCIGLILKNFRSTPFFLCGPHSVVSPSLPHFIHLCPYPLYFLLCDLFLTCTFRPFSAGPFSPLVHLFLSYIVYYMPITFHTSDWNIFSLNFL